MKEEYIIDLEDLNERDKVVFDHFKRVATLEGTIIGLVLGVVLGFAGTVISLVVNG